jgi:FMN phosphatase YigB (HAD superfamily)
VEKDPVKPRISLLIVDLDNTLYDWITFFVSSFYEMVEVASGILGLPPDQLLDELKSVHQKHHDSEYPFALLETRSVQAQCAGLSRLECARRLDPAFAAFNRRRRETLRSYDGVRETLTQIGSHCPIVAHTEASTVNALFRLDMLELTTFMTRLYAVTYRGLAHPDPARQVELDSQMTAMKVVGVTERKPDVAILRRICTDLSVSPGDALYVGDSLTRDVGMAREAGVWSAWAKYGTKYEASDWQKLVRVTHWTREDVDRVQRAQLRYSGVRPDVTLEKGFAEILSHFTF